jgi:hypothetical protein
MNNLAELLWDIWPLLARLYAAVRHPREHLAGKFREDELRQVFLIMVATLGFSLFVVALYMLLVF